MLVGHVMNLFKKHSLDLLVLTTMIAILWMLFNGLIIP